MLLCSSSEALPKKIQAVENTGCALFRYMCKLDHMKPYGLNRHSQAADHSSLNKLLSKVKYQQQSQLWTMKNQQLNIFLLKNCN